MCMICNDWKAEKMTGAQLAMNLFEMKEELGKEHTKEILIMVSGEFVMGDKILHQILEFCKVNSEQSDSRPQL